MQYLARADGDPLCDLLSSLSLAPGQVVIIIIYLLCRQYLRISSTVARQNQRIKQTRNRTTMHDSSMDG